ncbi:MAG TPA: hypothetical protein PK971_17005, partial [Saprospiraceae bacterium]|nr:hypothetical protein [Saprospiraceae bacterium]
MRIRIIAPGPQATIQDLGRPQWRGSGVPAGGAADTLSHRMANMLLGNAPGAASLELIGGGSRMEVTEPGWLAWAGLGATCWIDGKAWEGARRAYMPIGTTLHFRAKGQGNYSYLACPGGWDVPLVLDSRSTCLSAHFGGLHGRPLQREDVLSARGALASAHTGCYISPYYVGQPPMPQVVTLRTLPGPERSLWGRQQQAAWPAATFLLTPQHDRMGVRLQPSNSTADLRMQTTTASTLPSSAVQHGT